MRILLINWQDLANPRSGGAEIHLTEIFRRIHERGHTIEWLTSGWKGGSEHDEIDGMQIFRAGTRYSFGAAAPLHFHRKLAGRRYDLVVEALNKVPVYSPIWVKKPVVLLVHHLFGTTAFNEVSAPLAAATWLQERPLHRVYARSPAQAISHSTATDLVARGFKNDQVTVIHPGVDLSYFQPSSSPTRAILPTFLYIGRLQRYKRVDLILEAFARLRRHISHARLVIAGKGDQRAALQKQAETLGLREHVHFAGFVTEEHKRNLLRTAWANVFVSPKEGWGITNIEAAACGTATIASDSAGLRESVVNGRTGMLVPHGDLSSLEMAMRQLGGNPGLVEELGRGAFEFAQHFSWERAADQTLAHLEESLASPRR